MVCHFIQTILALIQVLLPLIQKHSSLIDWSPDGNELTIINVQKFISEVLPTYFRHGKMESFVRQVPLLIMQLNMYDFKKIVRKKNSVNFRNIHFRRGNDANFGLIKRRNYKKESKSKTEEAHQSILDHLGRESLENNGISTLLEKLLDFKTKT